MSPPPSLYEALSDPDEGAYLRPLVGNPRDLHVRRAYIDWLDERGDPRGELIAILDALSTPWPPDAASLRERATALAAEVDPQWLSAVRLTSDTFNCGQAVHADKLVRFAYACPRRWESLAPTGDPQVRHCEGCHHPVHLCVTLEEAEARAKLGACIAVPGGIAAEAHDRYTQMMVGRPHLPDVWARRLFGQ